MALTAGTKLGPYEILAPLGAGGMGEVYHAKDTRLQREVAIKVLPEHLAASPEARQRLEREARSISQFSHPHICTLYDVGHHDNHFFLVIEYLQGETLAERLKKGALPLPELLTIATQIADALDQANRQGLIHRDLKPANIMLTRGGAKLLDFGLAKATGEAASGGSGDAPPERALDLTTTPTRTGSLTVAGSIVGTFQYMAPEILEGRPADARSDIFSFGAVLYEMATGARAFAAESQAGLIAAILEREPPSVTAAQPMLPPSLDRLVQTCLAKDPDDRRQSMHDVLLDLRWIKNAGSQAGVPAPVTRRRRRYATLAWTAAAVFALLSATLGWVVFSRPGPPPAVKTVSHLLPPAGLKFSDWPAGHLALSPDGRSLAYVTYGYEYGAGNAAAGADDRQLWVRDFDNPKPRLLPGTGSASHPFWSPDGKSLAYFTAGALRRIDATGGSPLTLAEISFTKGGTWGRNGTILYAPSRFGSPLWQVPANGGEPRPATDLKGQDNVTHRWPFFLPDGEHFIYTVQVTGEPPSLHLADLDGAMDRTLVANASNGLYADGLLIYARGNTLLSQPFDTAQLELTGESTILVSPVAQWGGKADFSASLGGTLVYTEQRKARGAVLALYDSEGRPTRTVSSPTALDDMAVSPDGRFLALSRDEPDSELFDIWTYDTTRDIFTRITFDGNGDDPTWSPDGKWIAYAHGGDLYRKRASGAGDNEELFSSTADKVAHDWSRDGNTILFAGVGQSGAENLWVLPLEEGGEPHAILDGPYRETHGQFSPDGKWLSYASSESGTLQVYIMNWPGLTEKWQVSRDGGGQPRWQEDSRTLYYLALDGMLLKVSLTPGTGGRMVGDPQSLFQLSPEKPVGIRTHQYAVLPGDKGFVVIQDTPATDERTSVVTLITGAWK